jgi:hypothetical protein
MEKEGNALDDYFNDPRTAIVLQSLPEHVKAAFGVLGKEGVEVFRMLGERASLGKKDLAKLAQIIEKLGEASAVLEEYIAVNPDLDLKRFLN